MKFLIDFIDSVSQLEIDEYLTNNNATVVRAFSSLNKCFLVESNSIPPVTAPVESVVRDDDAPIQLLSFPQLSFSTGDNDQWWKLATFSSPDFEAAVETVDRRGLNATVYIVDSGVKADHPDLLSADVQSIYSFNGDTADYNGHGTAIASVISGDTCGVTSAKIRSAKIFQDGVTTLQSHLLAAFDAVISDAALNSGMSIVNLSWSIPKNSLIESKITIARSMGLAVVVAAGNSGIPIEDVTPASMENVITVGAYGQTFAPSNFSNYTGPISTSPGAVNGGALDVWTPGEGIKVALLNGGFGNISGTSVAAAIHSACLAYSADSVVFSNGQLVSTEIMIDEWRNYARAKAGLIDLSNPIYTTSTNNVSALFSTQHEIKGQLHTTISISVISSHRFAKRLLDISHHDLSSVVFSTPLPAGVLYDNGWIHGTITTSAPTLWESTITFDSLLGESKSIDLRMGMLPDSDKSLLDQNDPAVQISLYSCTPEDNPPGSGLNWYCGGVCASIYLCWSCGVPNAKDPGDLDCQCANVQCP